MNPLILAQEIIDGRRITRKDDLSFFLTCDLDELCEGADRIREAYIGDKVDLCSIINGRSGRCPENCKYCAQSVHHHTSCEIYDFLPEEKILEACKMNEEEGVDRFSIVTAGKALTGKEFDQAIHAYETMYKECNIDLCASMGFLSSEQLHRLHEACQIAETAAVLSLCGRVKISAADRYAIEIHTENLAVARKDRKSTRLNSSH